MCSFAAVWYFFAWLKRSSLMREGRKRSNAQKTLNYSAGQIQQKKLINRSDSIVQSTIVKQIVVIHIVITEKLT